MSHRRKKYPRQQVSPPHNYVKPVLDFGLTLERGTVTILNVLHDDWCPKLVGGLCRCTPAVEKGR